MGAAATGAFALAGVALAGCSNTSASSEKSSEKEKAVKPVILVTSFGTSYNDSRHITIGAIEDAIREKYWQDYDIRRAFTAQIIIDKLKKRDGITIDNMTEALDRCVGRRREGNRRAADASHGWPGIHRRERRGSTSTPTSSTKSRSATRCSPPTTTTRRWPQPL